MSKARDWLEGIGLGQYATALEDNDIGYKELTELTEDDLRTLGVSIGHMRKMLRAIRDIRPDPAPAQRRQLTVLFADIVDFTKLSSKVDPEDLLDTVNSFQTKSTAVIEEYRGMVAKFVGDGLLAFFGWPVASERDPVNCVRAAMKLSEMINEEIKIDGVSLQVRVGVATGLAVVGDLASNVPDVFGDVPNLASRLQGFAEPGSVLISEGTHRLVSHIFECEPTGELDIKGLGEVKAWAVSSEMESSAQTRLSSPTRVTRMQGRDEELTLLNAQWEKVKSGSFEIACIEGEAGLGKSRLTSEFISSIKKGAEVLSLLGSPDAGQSPMGAIGKMIERVAGFIADDAPTQRIKKIDRILDVAGLDKQLYLPVFSDVCGVLSSLPDTGMTPERRKAVLFEGVKLLIEAKAAKRPVLVLIEDLHWLDPATLELAMLLGNLDQDLPIHLVSTTRPEQSAPWGEPNNAILLRLKPLSREHASQFLQETLGGGNDVLANVIGKILERADGIPLYLEELAWSVHLTIDTLAIPSTLQDSLMARLDRLGDVREIAQVASILGRDIEETLLIEVLGKKGETVRAGLDRLVSEQVLTKTKTTDRDGFQYRFRHALLLEAAYDSQLMRNRRDIHAKVADMLIAWSKSGKATSAAMIAHHLSKTDRPTEAAVYYRQAGLLALTNAHYEDAEKLLKLALSELARGNEDNVEASIESQTVELEMKTELGSVLIAREGFGAAAVGTAFEDAERIGRALGPGPALARALWGMWLYKLVSGDLIRALELSHEICALGEGFAAFDGSGLLLEGRWALGNSQFWVADLDSSIDSLHASLELYDLEAHGDHAAIYGQDPFIAAQCYISYTQSIRGYHSAAWASQRAAINHAQKIDHPFSTAWALCFPAVVSTFRGEAWAAKKLAAGALRHTSEQIMPFWQTAMTITHGWAVSRTGDIEAGLAEAQAGLEFYSAIGSKTVQPYFRGLVADCLARAGKADEAKDMLQSAFDLAKETGERLSETRLHLIAAELAEMIGNPGSVAVGHLREAISQARETGANSSELDAAYALAMLEGQSAAADLHAAFERSPEPKKSRIGRRAMTLLAELDAEDV